jgi:hypothetical protein
MRAARSASLNGPSSPPELCPPEGRPRRSAGSVRSGSDIQPRTQPHARCVRSIIGQLRAVVNETQCSTPNVECDSFLLVTIAWGSKDHDNQRHQPPECSSRVRPCPLLVATTVMVALIAPIRLSTQTVPNGGLTFGAGGFLYVSAGDGASFHFTDYGQTGTPPNPCGDPPVSVGGSQTPPSVRAAP